MFGQRPEVEIAGPDLGPGVGNADQGLFQVLVGKTHGLEHGAGRCPLGAFGDVVAVAFTGIHGGMVS
jgi:hypothetical protein